MNTITSFFDRIDAWIDRTASSLDGKKCTYNPTIFGSILFIIFSTVMLVLLPSQVKVSASQGTINAQTFPKILLQIMLCFSVVLLVIEIVKVAMKKPVATMELDLLSEIRMLIILGLLVAFLLLIRPLGFILASALFCAGLVAYFRVRKWYYYAIVIGASVAIGILFRYVLHVRLP